MNNPIKTTPHTEGGEPTLPPELTLKDYGWRAHLQAQLSEDDLTNAHAVRVLAVHRDALDVAGPEFSGRAQPMKPGEDDEAQATAGDWVLIDDTTHRVTRVLTRTSLFKRRIAGTERRVQLLAANVDTLVLVTSANQDFNIARLERYLALALEAEVTPVVVITKADLAEDANAFAAQARRLMPGLAVETVDARTGEVAKQLAPWLGTGQTLAFLGSSGVGKSTLVNTLAGGEVQLTQGIREGDERGMHTTTGRSLHRLPSGVWLMDTPGMRELQLIDSADGLDQLFDDVVTLAAACRFKDCAHLSEPGCAIQAAIASGELDAERLKRYQKLQREERRNSESLAKSRARSKSFGKVAKRVYSDKLKGREW